MSDLSVPTLHKYRPSRLLRWLPVAVLLVILAFALVVLAAVLFEGASWGAWLAVLLPVLALYFAVVYWRMAYTVTVDDGHLTIRRIGREKSVTYDEILHAQLRYNTLTLHTAGGKISLHGEPNPPARLHAALEELVPALARQRQARRARPLPIHFRKERLSRLLPLGLLSLAALALIAALLSAWSTGRLALNLEDVLLTLFFTFVAGLILAIAIGLFLGNVDRVTFAEDAITVQTLRGLQRYAVDNLRDVRLKTAERTVRGVPRTFYTLKLVFDAEGRPVEIGSTLPASAPPTASWRTRPMVATWPWSTPPNSSSSIWSGRPRTTSAPAKAVADVLGYARTPAGRRPEAFEELRDAFNDLGGEAMPDVLDAARAAGDDDLLELPATVLVDNGYPPAYTDFVAWLDHPNDEVRFVCAWALDALAGGAFGVSEMMEDGFVQHGRIRAVAPEIRVWWQREGRLQIPTLAQWREVKAAQQPIGELEKWFNFLALNPMWVRFGDGTVAKQEKGFRLPRGQGVHLVSGRVWLRDADEPTFAAFVMDSDLGSVGGVYVRDGRRWVDVGQHMVRAEPNFAF